MKLKKIVMFILVFVLIFSFSATVFAENTISSKEEIVYAILSGDGSASSVYVVNSYANLTNNLIDYGDYSSIRNLSTKDDIKNENGLITSSVSTGKFYYEGKMNSFELPWNINISYKLDGNTVSAENILGASGKIEIKLDITKNTKAKAVFYENFALSISTSFDTNICSDIVASGAIIANSGESKNLAYTLLPKNDASYIITTTSTGFEMGAISFNAVPFNMNVAIKGIDNITESFKPLTTGVAKLNTGATTLSNGANELKTGVEELNKNKDALANGSSEILKAISEIATAISSMNGLADENGDLAKLSGACKQYKAGFEKAINGISQIAKDDDDMKALINALKQYNNPYVNSFITIYNGKMSALDEAVTGLNILNNNFSQIQGGVDSISKNIGSISLLSDALSTLLEEYKKFDKGISEFTTGYGKMSDGYLKIANGVSELKTGISTLNNSTSNLGTIIDEKIATALTSIGGGDFKMESFTSDKNTNISAVQFVIKLDAIKAPLKTEVPAQKPVKLSFWQKILNLFKKQN